MIGGLVMINGKALNEENLKMELRAQCDKCFGFCCAALYFSAAEGFPVDKEAGKPCINLMEDYKCKVHSELRKKGLKGCTAYDCFGAGQKVAEIIYKGRDWRVNPEIKDEMFNVFLIVRQLQEMLWYLNDAIKVQEDLKVKEKIMELVKETETLTILEPSELKKVDLILHRHKVNQFLAETSELVRRNYRKGKKSSLKRKKKLAGRDNFIGFDFKNINLIGEDLRGALLIAADLRNMNLEGVDFIGADMRDTDLRGADLSKSIFITQPQINSAKGNEHTKLPDSIDSPSHW